LRAWISSNRIIIALVVAALACVGIASYAAVTTYFAAAGEPPANQKPKQPVAVAALGRIEPRSEIISLGAGVGAGLGAGVASDRLDSLLVARGDPVQKGQVLGYLGGHAEQMAEIGLKPQRSTNGRSRKSRRNGSRRSKRRLPVSKQNWPTTRTFSLRTANCTTAGRGRGA
jgi:multidrug efflux pump subunit AcrA (membrane-fusion protein)